MYYKSDQVYVPHSSHWRTIHNIYIYMRIAHHTWCVKYVNDSLSTYVIIQPDWYWICFWRNRNVCRGDYCTSTERTIPFFNKGLAGKTCKGTLLLNEFMNVIVRAVVVPCIVHGYIRLWEQLLPITWLSGNETVCWCIYWRIQRRSHARLAVSCALHPSATPQKVSSEYRDARYS